MNYILFGGRVIFCWCKLLVKGMDDSKFSKLMHANYIFSVLLATSSAHLEDLAYLDEQRHTPLRTSLRMPRQSMGGVRTQQDLRGQNTEGCSGA